MDAFDIFTDIQNQAKALGITLTEAARSAKIDPGLVSRWRNRHVEPKISTLNRLRDSLTAIANMRAETKASSELGAE